MEHERWKEWQQASNRLLMDRESHRGSRRSMDSLSPLPSSSQLVAELEITPESSHLSPELFPVFPIVSPIAYIKVWHFRRVVL